MKINKRKIRLPVDKRIFLLFIFCQLQLTSMADVADRQDRNDDCVDVEEVLYGGGIDNSGFHVQQEHENNQHRSNYAATQRDADKLCLSGRVFVQIVADRKNKYCCDKQQPLGNVVVYKRHCAVVQVNDQEHDVHECQYKRKMGKHVKNNGRDLF